ncbi:SHOCT domain-containing protein, partial [Streptomyces lavendulae]|uniref:SHOCT domain-containing protein n=1 Tax=Streptomyces lavendulae TaxID=1914 RepID=UPI00340E412E
MPGLLRGVARTAVVAGTATAVSNRVSRRQGGRWAEQEAQQQQAAAAAAPALRRQVHVQHQPRPTVPASRLGGGRVHQLAQV